LTVLVDAILRCPAFLPRQLQQVLELAGGLGFVSAPSKVCSTLLSPFQHVLELTDFRNCALQTIDVFYAQPSSSRPSLSGIAWPSVDTTVPQVKSSASASSNPFFVGDTERIKPERQSFESPSPFSDARFDAANTNLLTNHSQLTPLRYTPTPSASYSFPSPSPRLASNSGLSNSSPSHLVVHPRQRRCSSISRRLNIDKALVLAVANELGIALA